MSLFGPNLSEIPDSALLSPKVVTHVIAAAYARRKNVGSEFVEHQNGVGN
jgi:hypothetical protein